MQTVKLATVAMATRFELVVRGEEDPAWLRAAGEEALAEIERLNDRLSFYSPSSDVARINRLAYHEPVPVEAGLFRLLRTCRALCEATSGAFDVTVGPLMRAWGLTSGSATVPAGTVVSDVLSRVGMHHVHLDESSRTVRFDAEGVEIDLGGIGKGCAIDEAMDLLLEAGVRHAFLHGGTSSIKATGDSPEGSGWTVAISAPLGGAAETPREEVLAVAVLSDRALSVSDIRGKWYDAGGEVFGHVLDPRTGRPVRHAGLAAVEADSAAEADALATALLVVAPEDRGTIAHRFAAIRALIASGGAGEPTSVVYNDFDPP